MVGKEDEGGAVRNGGQQVGGGCAQIVWVVCLRAKSCGSPSNTLPRYVALAQGTLLLRVCFGGTARVPSGRRRLSCCCG